MFIKSILNRAQFRLRLNSNRFFSKDNFAPKNKQLNGSLNPNNNNDFNNEDNNQVKIKDTPNDFISSERKEIKEVEVIKFTEKPGKDSSPNQPENLTELKIKEAMEINSEVPDEDMELPPKLDLEIFEPEPDSSDNIPRELRRQLMIVAKMRENEMYKDRPKEKKRTVFRMRYEEVVNNKPGRPYHRQPTFRQIMAMLNLYEMKKFTRLTRPVDFFKINDEIEVTLRESMSSEKVIKKRGIVLNRKKRFFGSNFTLKITDANQMCHKVVYPFYSPLIKSIRRTKVGEKRKVQYKGEPGDRTFR